MGFVGRRIGRADLVEQRLQPLRVAILEIRLVPVELLERGIVEDFALAGRRKHDELVAKSPPIGPDAAFIGTAWMPMRWKVRR